MPICAPTWLHHAHVTLRERSQSWKTRCVGFYLYKIRSEQANSLRQTQGRDSREEGKAETRRAEQRVEDFLLEGNARSHVLPVH